MNSLPTCTFLNNIGDTLHSIDSPVQLKLINFLGLKNYMIDNFIFKRKTSKYIIRNSNNKNVLIVEEEEYQPPPGYRVQAHIIQTSSHSIPVCRLIPLKKSNRCAIIYAHGNASDMADSLSFVQRLSQRIHTDYVIFDYTGYGESRVPDVGQEIICKDLQILLSWVTESIKLKDILLWGFSLGTFPVVMTAAKYKVGGVILQCPIASVSCMFHSNLHPDMKFRQDYFANIDHITQVKSKIFIMHSSADEIIPFQHSKVLYQKYINKNGQKNIDFIQVGKLKHNSLHKYLVSPIDNQLQKQVFNFLYDIIQKYTYIQIFKTGQNSIKSAQSLPVDLCNTEPNIAIGQQEVQQQPSTTSTKQTSWTQDRLSLQLADNQLRQIRMTITLADIPKIIQDMQQLIIHIDDRTKRRQSSSISHLQTLQTLQTQKQQTSKQSYKQHQKRLQMQKKYSQYRQIPNAQGNPNNLNRRSFSQSKLRLNQLILKQKINKKIVGNCFCFPNN